MKNFLLTILGGMLVIPPAYPISRVGNGKEINSVRSGYTFEIPAQFCSNGPCFAVEINPDMLRLEDRTRYISSGFGISIPLRLVASEFLHDYPTWSALSRADLVKTLKGYGWSPIQSSDSCQESWIIIKNDIFTMISTWGSGKGLVMYGPYDATLYGSAESIVKNLKLTPDACAW